MGGTVKRQARRASRQLSFIMTPLDLYKWAVDNITGIDFAFVTKEQISVDAELLIKRMNSNNSWYSKISLFLTYI